MTSALMRLFVGAPSQDEQHHSMDEIVLRFCHFYRLKKLLPPHIFPHDIVHGTGIAMFQPFAKIRVHIG